MISDEEDNYVVKLRAEIVIDIDAVDYLDAAEHQKRIEALLGDLRAAYPAVVVSTRPRRAGRVRGEPGSTRLRHYTGRLNSYD